MNTTMWIRLLSLLTLFFARGTSLEILKNFIQFVSKSESQNVVEKYTDSSKISPWDASMESDKYYAFFNRTDISLELSCLVSTLDKDFKLSMMKFCFALGRASTPAKDWQEYSCTKMWPHRTKTQIKPFPEGNSTIFDLTFDPFNGGSVRFTSQESENIDISFAFYCKARNILGSLRSRNVYLLDLMNRNDFSGDPVVSAGQSYFPKGQLDGDKHYHHNISRDKISLNYRDMPFGYFGIVVNWFFCDAEIVITTNHCPEESSIPISRLRTLYASAASSYNPFMITFEGDLVIPYFTSKLTERINKKRFFYQIVGKKDRIYTNVFSIKSSGHPKESLKLYTPFPMDQLTVSIPTPSVMTWRSSCAYHHGSGNIALDWTFKTNRRSIDYKKGVDRMSTILGKDLHGTYKYNGMQFSANEISYDSKTAQIDKIGGFYTCEVTFTTESTKVDKLQLVISIIVDDVITSVKVVPERHVLAIDGAKTGVDIQCEFAVYEKTDYDLEIKVNGFTKDQVGHLPHLATFPYNFTTLAKKKAEKENLAHGILSYKASELTLEEADGKTSHHQYQCIYKQKGDGAIGEVTAYGIVEVIPKPVFGKTPGKYVCNPCNSKDTHYVKCVVENKNYYQSRGIKLHHNWKLGDDNVGTIKSLRKYWEIKDDGAVFKMKPTLKKEFPEYLRSHLLQCEVALYLRSVKIWDSNVDLANKSILSTTFMSYTPGNIPVWRDAIWHMKFSIQGLLK